MTIAPALPPALVRAEHATCAHCRTPLAKGADDAFCCHGCRSVYTLLQEAGLERYYALRGDRTLLPVAGGPTVHELPWLDALADALAQQQGIRRFTLDLQGLQCGACVWLIEALFRRQPAAHQVRVNPALGQLSCVVGVDFPLRAFVTSIERFGYRVGPSRKATTEAQRGLLLRTGICLALALNTMLLSAATYFGLERGPLFELVNNASFVMATLSALVGGSYFVRRALLGLERGVLHLDLPIALGMLLAYAGSALSFFFDGARGSYLDTISVFIALMLVGRWLQERLVEKNRRALLSADGASSLIARRVREGKTELVSCVALRPDDTLLVCPGELVPVRGRLDEDSASCALDWINGESEPRVFRRGDELVAGAINASTHALRITALAGFERSDLDALLRDEGGERLRPRGDFWDALARIYVFAVLGATAIGVVAWMLYGAALTSVLDVATAVLVVTCPCAFGIATPFAYELGVAGLRRVGLFVRDASFFDRAASVRRIVFDKTGTLTTGALALEKPAQLLRLSHRERSALYDLTAQSNHPKSAAIARTLAASDPHIALSGCLTHEVAGHGVEYVRDGVRYRLGDPGWALGETEITSGPVFSANARHLATLPCVEVARPDAAAEAEALRHEHYELWIASGDISARVQAFSAQLGIPPAQALGDLSPADKRDLIDRLDQHDTLMIGDGINDGPALSRALCSGTPAVDRPFVPARADFYFLTPGLHPVRLALRVASHVRRVVHRALWFASAYNVFAVGLAYAGLMRPWLAAVLMPASSLLVLAYTVFALSPRNRIWKS